MPLHLLSVLCLIFSGALVFTSSDTLAASLSKTGTRSSYVAARPKPKPAVKRRTAKPARRTVARKTGVRARSAKAAAPATLGRSSLSGTIFYLASGHGGPDPGAIGRYGRKLLPEDEYAYDVTIRLAELLKQKGAQVFMLVQDPNDGIRDAAVLKLDRDEVAYPHKPIPLDQTARLRQTTTAVNKLYARHKSAYQRFITIHVDSRTRGQMIDVFFYHHSNSKVGKRLAKHIHQRFRSNYKRHRPDRPYSGNVSTRNGLYVIKNSHPPTVFIELGNIQNRLDQRRFLLASNRLALASWMMQGIVDDYKSR